jgi:hypothetical protein
MKVFLQLFTGFYLFIETSSPRQFGDKATILTPYLNGTQCMKFSYHMYGGGIGVLNIYANNQRMFSKSGNQGNRWVGVETSILQRGRYMVSKEISISDTQTTVQYLSQRPFLFENEKEEGPEEISVRTLVILLLCLNPQYFCPQPERIIQCCCCTKIYFEFPFQESK